jgi:hypothetical protein
MKTPNLELDPFVSGDKLIAEAASGIPFQEFY